LQERAIPVLRTELDDNDSRRIAEILEGFGDAFIAFDFDWRILSCNRAAAAHFGLRRDEAPGRNIWSLFPFESDAPIRRFFDEAMTSRDWLDREVPSAIRPGRWLNLRAFPMETGLGVSFQDITERRERLQREHEQAERLKLALATSGFGEWSWDAATDLVELSEEARRAYGLPSNAAITWTEMLEQIHPEDRARVREAGRKAIEEHSSFESDYRIRRARDGAERWIMTRGQGQYGEGGQVVGLRGVASDITRVKADEAQVRADRARLGELERRRAYLLEIADALGPIDDPDVILSTAARMMGERLDVARVGYAEVGEDGLARVLGDWTRPGLPSLLGRAFRIEMLGATVPGDLPRGLDLAVDDVSLHPSRAAAPEAYESIGVRAVIIVPLIRDGRLDAVFYAHDAQPRAWTREDVALMDDVAARTWSALAHARVERQAAERQRLLINELNHRVKNTLATIQSLAHQTLREGLVTREARERLTERLLALSTAHNVLTRENWLGAKLGEIAREAVRPFDDPPGQRIALHGPEVRLAPNAALALSMALHELATNAVKYGALSKARGHVAVRWTFEPGRSVVALEWREAGGPPVAPPRRKGFGARLLAGLTGDLVAPAEVSYNPTGLVCRLRIPVT
jgi:PAS domain S-box-containing protein